MRPPNDVKAGRRRQAARLERGIFFVFISIALIASTGLTFAIIQERSRIHLTAEYKAYQLATALLHGFLSGEEIDYRRIEGLIAFGVYSTGGSALCRTDSAPRQVEDFHASERFRNDRIRLLMNLEMNPGPNGGHMRRGESPNRAMTADRLAGRYMYIEYAAPEMRKGITLVVVVGAIAIFALLLAVAIVLSMFRRLEAYRGRESKLKELAALGEAARTLAHEVKNPLAIIAVQCALVRKKGGDSTKSEILAIEGETHRLASLVDRIREAMIQGESSSLPKEQSED